eukprot:425137_1
MGIDRLRGLWDRAPWLRNRASGQPGAPSPRHLHWEGEHPLPRQPGGHRLPHHNGQRAGGSWLGRGGDRGGKCDAGDPDVLPPSPRGGLQAHRRPSGRRDCYRPCPHLREHAEEARRRWEVRRVLWAWLQGPPSRGPSHHRKHGSRVWRNMWVLPSRQRLPAVPSPHRAGRTPSGGDRTVPLLRGHVQ